MQYVLQRHRIRRAWSAHFAGATAQLRPAVVATAAMLLSFGSGLLLERLAHLNVDIVFLTVVLSLTLARKQQGKDRRQRVLGVAVLPVIAVAAGEVGEVMVHHENLGDVLFVASISGGVLLRRFGPLAARASTLIAMPFIALMVTPVPAPPTGAAPWWGAVATLIALAWAWGAEAAAARLGFLKQDPAESGRAERAGTAQPASKPPQNPQPRQGRRLAASDRMGLQMAVALGSAFALGRWLFPHHWTWMVLTAFIVSSGNRGRGDVVYKSLLRFGGAAVGSVTAALLVGLFPPHDPAAIAVIFAVLAVAGWLRNLSYAYWAGCITTVLSVLYGYFGEDVSSLLPTRLESIVLGAVLAVAAAWFVFPVRTGDVVRRRLADVLAALGDFLTAARGTPAEMAEPRTRLATAIGRIDEVAHPVKVHRRVIGRARPHPADALEAVRGCVGSVDLLCTLADEEPAALTGPAAALTLGHAARSVGEARRSLARRPSGDAAVPNRRGPATAVHADLHRAAADIVEAMDILRRVYTSPPPSPLSSPHPTATGAFGVIPHSAHESS